LKPTFWNLTAARLRTSAFRGNVRDSSSRHGTTVRVSRNTWLRAVRRIDSASETITAVSRGRSLPRPVSNNCFLSAFLRIEQELPTDKSLAQGICPKIAVYLTV